MGRRARGAVALGVAAALVAAVMVLRDGTSSDLDLLLDPDGPVIVERFAADTVTLPDAGPLPVPPGRPRVRTEPDRVQVEWDPAPGAAVGYQVRWSRRGGEGGELLAAGPGAELTGLAPGRYGIQIRTVDAVGRRSNPAFTSAVLPNAPDTAWQLPYDFVDGFGGDSPQPDPARWQATSVGRFCLRAGPGAGVERGRAVLALDCGTALHTLAPTTPLRLAPRGSGELGRVAVITDAPGSGGTLSIDLVPGPADAVGSDPGAPRAPAAPGRAVEDPTLPPGTLRVVLGEGSPTVLAGPDVPRSGRPPAMVSVQQAPGVTHRIEVVLRDDGLLVLRNGAPIGGADVVVPWPQARVLIGFAGPPGGAARIRLDAVAVSGDTGTGDTEADKAGVEPAGHIVRDVVRPARLVLPGTAGEPGTVDVPPGATSAQLRALIRPASTEPIDDLTAVVGTTTHRRTPLRGGGIVTVPVRAAVQGTAPVPGSVYPVVADLPAALLSQGELPAMLLTSMASPGAEVVDARVLFPGAAPARALADPPPPKPSVPVAPAVRMQVLDAAGMPPEPGRPFVRGRLVVDVRVDGRAGQREGALAGLAGIELWLDGQRIAAVPTARGVPAVGGTHRFGVRTAGLATGPHTLGVRAVPADRGVEQRRTERAIQLG